MPEIILPVARPAITDSSFYRPDWVSQRTRDPKLLWLDKNENNDPEYLALVRKVYLELSPHHLSSYPENSGLYHKLANFLGVSPHNLLLSAGSDGAIRSAFEAFISPGDVVIYTQPTFAMYPVYAKMYEAQAYPISYETGPDGPYLSVAKLIESIRQYQPRMVCVPNPDSPTGTIISPAELKAILNEAAEVGALMLIDEAYYPFYPETALVWVKSHPNLLVTRSTGKAWGMAGFRLGYAVAAEPIIAALQKLRAMYETNTIAFALMERVLDFEPQMLASVKRLEEGKAYFIDEMQNLGFKTLKTYGNFLHVCFGTVSATIHQALAKVVYYRPDFNEACLKGYSRFSSTTRERFTRVVDCITTVLD